MKKTVRLKEISYQNWYIVYIILIHKLFSVTTIRIIIQNHWFEQNSLKEWTQNLEPFNQLRSRVGFAFLLIQLDLSPMKRRPIFFSNQASKLDFLWVYPFYVHYMILWIEKYCNKNSNEFDSVMPDGAWACK